LSSTESFLRLPDFGLSNVYASALLLSQQPARKRDKLKSGEELSVANEVFKERLWIDTKNNDVRIRCGA
jgi:hypothetical protein